MDGRKIRYAVALGLGMLLVGGQAGAVPFYSPITTFEDDDVDFHVDTNGNGLLDVGERLKGVLEIPTVFGSQLGQGPVDLENDTGEELTGVFDITITSKTDAGGGLSNFTFGPSGAAGILGAGGSMLRLWTDATPDLNLFGPTNCTSQTDCENRAGLGGAMGSVLFLDLGFAGDADESWAATNAQDNTAAVLAGGPNQVFGNFNNSLSILANNTGQTFAQQACFPFCGAGGDGLIEWVGSGTINGGNQLAQGLVDDGGVATSDFQASLVTAAVPEPQSLTLLAVGLISLGMTLRIGRRKA